MGQRWADCDALPEFRRAFAEAYPWAQARGYRLTPFPEGVIVLDPDLDARWEI